MPPIAPGSCMHAGSRNTPTRVRRAVENRLLAGVMIEEGFAVPDLQTVLPNILDPSSPFRVDGSWKTPDGRLIVFENDGEEKYKMFSSSHGAGAVRRMMRERQRESLLTAACDALIRFDYHTVKTPGALARLLDSYGVPRVRS